MTDRVDFGSDTVTEPSEGIRKVMAAASVGDAVYGDDPTANRLEAMTADCANYGHSTLSEAITDGADVSAIGRMDARVQKTIAAIAYDA